MSGWVAMVGLDHAPIDRDLLSQMTRSLEFRGRDGRGIWVDGPVGFGHTLLRTHLETAGETARDAGLCTLGGGLSIAADARLDGREELIGRLDPGLRNSLRAVSDAELILHAFRTWGEKCLEYLMGDFCFALWDQSKRTLFCARDQFGLRPFYYAQGRDYLAVSNTLECLRLHPGVSGRLNDLALADFLIFGRNQDPATTSFTDIQQLPAGHALSWRSGTLHVGRYWTLPVPEPVRYRHSSEYVAHFKSLLQQAVTDRITSEHTGILMSGGLDSTMVAAAAKQTGGVSLKAFTLVNDRLFRDPERHYAGVTAGALGIPIQYLGADDYPLFGRPDQLPTPEPFEEPLWALLVDQLQQVSEFSSVALSGQGGDSLFFPSADLATQMLQSGRFRELAVSASRYVRLRGRIPPLGFRGALKRKLGKVPSHSPVYPVWLNPQLETELHLPERWEHSRIEPAPVHRERPTAYEYLTSPFWPSLFERYYDAGYTKVPVEVRHPLFDLRLVSYLLAIPPIPWCIDKTLPRLAMRGTLPDEIRLRPKTPLQADPIALRLKGSEWIDRFEPLPALDRFVDRNKIPKVAGEQNEPAQPWWPHLRPYSLNLWLKDLTKPQFKDTKDINGITQRIA